MNKFIMMKQRLVRSTVIALLLIAGAGGILFLTDNLAEGVAKEKADADAALAKDTADLQMLKNKIERSGVAEKRYGELQANRSQSDMVITTDALVQVLRDEKTHFRLSSFKMVLGAETAATQLELVNQNIDVLLRSGVTVEFESISDLHAFSFLDNFIKNSPGLVSIKSIEMERKADMSSEVVTQLQSGQNVPLVTTKMQLTLVSVQPKVAATAGNGSGAVPKLPNTGGAP